VNGLVRLDGDVRVRITVSGLKSEVESFLQRTLTGEVVLDRFVPAAGQEANRVAVQPVDVTFRNRPTGVTIVFPEGLPTVSVSRKDEWYATLRVDLSTIQVSDGYEVRGANVDPEQVRVIGPTELKPRLKEIVIGEGVLQQKSGERSYEQSVVKSQLISLIGLPNVDLDLAQRVTVTVVIGPRSLTKDINLPHGIIVSTTVEEVPGEPRSIFQSGLDLKLDVAGTQLVPEQPVRVTLTGPQAAVESVERDPERYRVLFDLTSILSRRDSRIFTIEGRIPNLPPGVRHEPIRGTIISGQ
jgi:YbbR domain-containing protein